MFSARPVETKREIFGVEESRSAAPRDDDILVVILGKANWLKSRSLAPNTGRKSTPFAPLIDSVLDDPLERYNRPKKQNTLIVRLLVNELTEGPEPVFQFGFGPTRIIKVWFIRVNLRSKLFYRPGRITNDSRKASWRADNRALFLLLVFELAFDLNIDLVHLACFVHLLNGLTKPF